MFKFKKDEAKCSGCRICEMACVVHNQKECNPRKSFIKIRGNFPEPGGYNIKILKGCTLCGQCIEFCPLGAIAKQEARK